MTLNSSPKKGFEGIADRIPDLIYRRIDNLNMDRLPEIDKISEATPLVGLPIRSGRFKEAFGWGNYDLEYFQRPTQERVRKESLDYVSALYVFRRKSDGSRSRNPVLIAGIFEDPETEVPNAVVFTADGAVLEEFSSDLSDKNKVLPYLFSLVKRNIPLAGSPKPLTDEYTQHPFSARHAPEKEALKKADPSAGEKKKTKGIASFWIAVIIGIAILSVAFYYSEKLFN